MWEKTARSFNSARATGPAPLAEVVAGRRAGLALEELGEVIRAREPKGEGDLFHGKGRIAEHLAGPAHRQLEEALEDWLGLPALLFPSGYQANVAAWSTVRPAGLPDAAFRPMPDNAADAAHELFDTLRRWDATGMRAICVETPPPGADWDGVRDRLQRAAAPR